MTAKTMKWKRFDCGNRNTRVFILNCKNKITARTQTKLAYSYIHISLLRKVTEQYFFLFYFSLYYNYKRGTGMRARCFRIPVIAAKRKNRFQCCV